MIEGQIPAPRSYLFATNTVFMVKLRGRYEHIQGVVIARVVRPRQIIYKRTVSEDGQFPRENEAYATRTSFDQLLKQ